tara:strand:- start:8784 stop:9242 length:459 start_codon:yes stop_codon:yes gene_type:complete
MDVDKLFKEIVDNLEDKKYNIKIPKIKNKKDKNKILNNVALIRDTLKHNYLKYRKKPSGKVLSDEETKFIVKYEEEFGDMGNVFKTGEIKKSMSMLDRYRKKIQKINKFQSPLSGITAEEATQEARKRQSKGGYKKSRKRYRKRKRKTKRKK